MFCNQIHAAETQKRLIKNVDFVPVILVLGEGVVVMVDPLLFQGQSLDLQLCALGLLHGLELMGCRHGTGEGGWLWQFTERST